MPVRQQARTLEQVLAIVSSQKAQYLSPVKIKTMREDPSLTFPKQAYVVKPMHADFLLL